MCIVWLSNTFYTVDGEKTGIHFFKFPMKNPEKLKWCNLIKRQDGKDNFKVTNGTYVCQNHFPDNAIKKHPNSWCYLTNFLPPLCAPPKSE